MFFFLPQKLLISDHIIFQFISFLSLKIPQSLCFCCCHLVNSILLWPLVLSFIGMILRPSTDQSSHEVSLLYFVIVTVILKKYFLNVMYLCKVYSSVKKEGKRLCSPGLHRVVNGITQIDVVPEETVPYLKIQKKDDL